MSVSQLVASCMVDATITASGQSAAFPLLSTFSNVVAEIQIGAAPTGTSPTLAFQLQVSLDGATTWENFGSATSNLNAAGLTTLSNTNAMAPLARVSYTIGGTGSPTFTQVSVLVYQN
jgi:hypothetical protein